MERHVRTTGTAAGVIRPVRWAEPLCSDGLVETERGRATTSPRLLEKTGDMTADAPPLDGHELSALRGAKRRLGIDHLLLQVHDASFPCDPDEEFGRGTPYSRGAERLFAFARQLGFDGIQLGPQGMTGRGQMSPYEATLFSRNPHNLPLARLAAEGLLDPAFVDACRRRVAAAPTPTPLALIETIFDEAVDRITERADDALRDQARAFLSVHRRWLVPDALYGALCREHGSGWWGAWHASSPRGAFDQRLFRPEPGEEDRAAARLAELAARHAVQIEHYAVIQWLLTVEQRRLRSRLAELGLTLFADLQVGLAPQDVWSHRSAFLADYLLGAPPSRTNPEGQPWGFTVLDPRQYGSEQSPGPVASFVRARLDRVLEECDGIRIDHPHGWIDPWVYRADTADPLEAVQHGARLFSSPDAAEHPALAGWAIARADQIARDVEPHGDRRVGGLDDAQVEAYGRLFALIVERLEAHGRPRTSIACEVLSTMPHPVQRVLDRFHLGRFRVTSRLKLDDPTDVYRIEHARPADWIMLGTHDTATVWQHAQEWIRAGLAPDWTRYLASLAPGGRAGPASSPSPSPAGTAGALVASLFTAMLASEARNVSVFFADLFGMTERYNRPGTMHAENWRLRVPADFEAQYEARRRSGGALDVPGCLAAADEEGGTRHSAAL